MHTARAIARLMIRAITVALPISALAASPHEVLTAKHVCDVEPSSKEAVLMGSFLTEKNAIDLLNDRNRVTNTRKTRLVDSFVSPEYRKRYRMLPGTVALDMFGSRPERLICIRREGQNTLAVTSISNPENGWTKILEYKLSEEAGEAYIDPTAAPIPTPPFPPQLATLRLDNDPTTYVIPHKVVAEYRSPRRK